MNFRRVRIKAIISVFIILILIGSSTILNVSGPDSDLCKTEIEDNQRVLFSSRSASINIKNFTDFSDGYLVENTRIDPTGHVGLTWEPPQSPYETDDDTLLLNHFDNNFDGEDGEKRREYIRSYKDLVGLWKLDEGIGTSTFDGSGKENHGTINGGGSWIGGKYGKALRFDGVDDYISIGSGVSTYIGNDITISAWVYSNPLAQSSVYRAIVTEGYLGDGNVEFELFLNGATHDLTAGFYDGTWYQVSEGTGFTLNQWTYVTVTYDGHYLRLYKDGNEIDTSADLNRPLPSGSNGWRIGRRHDNGAASDLWNGKIDDVSIYSRAKSADEIKTDYDQQISDYIPFETGKFDKGVRIEGNNTFPYYNGMPLDSDCVGFWRFDEGSGNSVNDSSGNGNLGMLVNGTTWVNGIVGKALDFDGTNDWVDCGNDLSLDVGGSDFTVSAWVNFPGSAGTIDVVAKRLPNAPSTGWVWHVTPTLTRLWTSAYGGVDYFYNFNFNTWYHIVLIRDKTNSKVSYYINGEKQITVTGESTDLSNTGILAIGRLSGEDNQYFNGKIDELAIYKSIRSPEEISGSYKSINSFDIDKGTLELWVKPNWTGSDGGNHTIFFSGQSWDNNSFFIIKDSDNFLKFITADNESNYQGFPRVNIGNWKKNNWYHLAFTWDSNGNKKIYINGDLKSSASNNPMPTVKPSTIHVGSYMELYGSFDGVIDELRISDTILTGDELREYDNQGIYESQGIDVGEAVSWEKISWMATTPPGTDLYLQTRISDDNATWSEWMGNISPIDLGQKVYLDKTGDPINATNSQYLQWRAILKSSDRIFSPTLEKVSITWNRLPKASNVKVTPSNPTVLDDLTMSYDYSDADLHSESDTTLEWYVRRGSDFIFSSYTGQTLSATRTARGERWLCKVTPHDGKDIGVSVNSNMVTISAGPITRIEVMPGNITITADETVTFSAKAYDAADNEITTSFEWDIKGNGTMDQTGKFVPEKAGAHAISATAGGILGYSVVEVIPGVFTNAKILPEIPTITTDDTIYFEALALDAKENNIANYSTTWSTTGGGIIDPETGIYDASLPGEWEVFANVTIVKLVNASGNISYANKSVDAETQITITPGKLDRITIDSSTLETNADSEIQFTATGYDMDNNLVGLDLIWWAENGTITPTGKFIPHAVGTWKIEVFGVGSKVFASITINVTEGKISNLILEPNQCILAIDEKCSFNAYVFDGKGNRWEITEGITWSASDTTLGTISNSGTFEAIKDGELKIHAELNQDGLDSAIIAEANIFIKADEEVGEDLEEELEEEQKTKKAVEQQNLLFLTIIVILVIIILVLLILFALSKRKKEPVEKEKEEEAEDEEEDWEVEEAEEEAEPEADEVELTESEDEDWEVEEEPEPAAEEIDKDIDSEFVVEPEMEEEIKKPPKKPIKGKMPKKGKFPGEKKKISRQRILKPAMKSKQSSNKPKLHTMNEAVKCNICLGYIKPGLNAVTCVCGKHFHEKCAERLSDCPVCETNLQEPEDLLEEEE